MPNLRYLRSIHIKKQLTKEKSKELGEVYTVQELAEKLNFSVSAIRYQRKKGVFRYSTKVGNTWYIIP